MMAGDCGSTCPVEGGFYAYDPNVGGNAVLLATFALLVPVVLFLGIRFRTPVFSATLATGLLLAVAGFLGRILLHGSPRNQGLFFLSLLGTLLGPVCISAANFLTLPHILSVYGDHISPLQPVVAGVVLYGLAAVAAAVQVVGVAFTAYDLSGLNVSFRLYCWKSDAADILGKANRRNESYRWWAWSAVACACVLQPPAFLVHSCCENQGLRPRCEARCRVSIGGVQAVSPW